MIAHYAFWVELALMSAMFAINAMLAAPTPEQYKGAVLNLLDKPSRFTIDRVLELLAAVIAAMILLLADVYYEGDRSESTKSTALGKMAIALLPMLFKCWSFLITAISNLRYPSGNENHWRRKVEVARWSLVLVFVSALSSYGWSHTADSTSSSTPARPLMGAAIFISGVVFVALPERQLQVPPSHTKEV